MKISLLILVSLNLVACAHSDFYQKRDYSGRGSCTTWACGNYPEPQKWDKKTSSFVPDPGFWDRKPAPDTTVKIIENGIVVREIEIDSDSY